MNITSENILNKLSKIKHPALGKDIIELQIVKNIKTDSDSISFDLQFPKPNDPLRASIKKACFKLLKNTFGAKTNIDIHLENQVQPQTASSQTNEILPEVKNIIAIASGKGGVGKSTLAVNLATSLAKKNRNIGLIDADIFGPSIPKMLNAEKERPFARKEGNKDLIIPIERYGVKVLSIGFFIDPSDATVWRGPMASNAFRQLITDTDWGKLDYLIVDLPPGTSDIHLTLVQTLAVTGAIIVSTPQAVALADVVKGINMFRNKNINVPILGLVENMAWFTPQELPENKYYIFGKEGCKKLAEEFGIPLLAQIPLVQSICEQSDLGTPVSLEDNTLQTAFMDLADQVIQQVDIRNRDLLATKKVSVRK